MHLMHRSAAFEDHAIVLLLQGHMHCLFYQVNSHILMCLVQGHARAYSAFCTDQHFAHIKDKFGFICDCRGMRQADIVDLQRPLQNVHAVLADVQASVIEWAKACDSRLKVLLQLVASKQTQVGFEFWCLASFLAFPSTATTPLGFGVDLLLAAPQHCPPWTYFHHLRFDSPWSRSCKH